MYLIAIVGDLLSFVPILNMIVSPLFTFLLALAGSVEGKSLFAMNRVAGTLGTSVAEFIPMFSMLPLLTVRVYLAKNDIL
jgi:hypothetical protein